MGAALVVGCGGSAFSSGAGSDASTAADGTSGSDGAGPGIEGGPAGDASSSGSSSGGEAGTGGSGGGEAGAVDGATPLSPVRCGAALTCSGSTPVCCLSSPPTCAHLECGCSTQLECASDLDCPLPTLGTCCIDNRNDAACASGHIVARCSLSCSGGAQQLCDPNAATLQCPSGQQCSPDSGDLQNVGLPSGQGYGVCK
jgi:hypothetical protein